MDISTGIAAGSLVIAGLALWHTRSETSRIKSNCIATLTRDVQDINKKLDTLKVDAIIERFQNIASQLENGCQRFAGIDKDLKEQHDQILTLNIHAESYFARLDKLYNRMDEHEMKVQRQLKEKDN